MTTNTELIADLQSNIVGDPFPLMRKAADAIEALESEIQRQYACIRSRAEITHKAEDERDALAAQLAAAQGQVEEQRKYKDSAYLERNRLVALLSKVFPSGKKKTAIEGWSEDWHGCVYIDLPTGQASWHYHDSQAWLFEHLPEYQGTWDGHTTDEKYERIQGYATPILQKPAKPLGSKGCPTCKHSDSWGLPDCPANGALCHPSLSGIGSNWEPLNAAAPQPKEPK